MSVRQRNKKWIIDIQLTLPDGSTKRVRKTSPVQTRRYAETYERELRRAILDGRYGKEEEAQMSAPVPTVKDFAKSFVADYASAHNKPSEIAAKESMLKNHLVPAFGNRLLNEIGAKDIDQYKARKLSEGLAAKTVNNQLAVLRRMLNVAKRYEVIEVVPLIEALRVEPPEFDFLSEEEAQELINAADSEWRCMITLALNSGLRLGELRALRWADVDLKRGQLTVNRSVWERQFGSPKSGKSRVVDLPSAAVMALKKQRHLRSELVFCTEDGKLIPKTQVNAPLYRAARLAKLRRVGWHVLRHSYASHLAMRGAPIKAIQELLGHSEIKMTMRYAHLSPNARRQAVDLLERSSGTMAAQHPVRNI